MKSIFLQLFRKIPWLQRIFFKIHFKLRPKIFKRPIQGQSKAHFQGQSKAHCSSKPRLQFFGILVFSFLSLPWICEANWDFEGFYRVRGATNHTLKTLELDLTGPEKSDSSLNYKKNKSQYDHLISNTGYVQAQYYFNQRFDVLTGLRFSATWMNRKIQFLEHEYTAKDLYRAYAYLNWNIGLGAKLQVGQFFYDFNIPQMISINNYESFPYVFSGLLFTYWAESVTVDLWVAKTPLLWRGLTGTPFSRDHDPVGGFGGTLNLRFPNSFIKRANLNVSVPGSLKELKPYIMWAAPTSGVTTSFDNYESLTGTRASLGIQGTLNRLNYFFMFSGHDEDGLNFKFKNRSTHLEFNYFKDQWFGSSFFGGYHSDSKDYEPWLYDRHSQAGWMDIFEWGNLEYFFFGYKIFILDLFNLELQALQFFTQERGDVNLGVYGEALFRRHGVVEKGAIGREFDIKLTKKINKAWNIEWLTGAIVFDDSWIKAYKTSWYMRSQLTAIAHF